jgi:hypothetical protein
VGIPRLPNDVHTPYYIIIIIIGEFGIAIALAFLAK